MNMTWSDSYIDKPQHHIRPSHPYQPHLSLTPLLTTPTPHTFTHHTHPSHPYSPHTPLAPLLTTHTSHTTTHHNTHTPPPTTPTPHTPTHHTQPYSPHPPLSPLPTTPSPHTPTHLDLWLVICLRISAPSHIGLISLQCFSVQISHTNCK